MALDKDLSSGINTAADLGFVLNSAYDRMSETGYYGRNQIIMGDVRTDNAYANLNSGRFSDSDMDYSSTGAGPWSTIYRVIAITNIVIGADTSSLTGSAGQIAHTQGQAYALRALVELSFISKDCDKSLVFINKAIELGGTVDAYTIAGTIYRKCNEFEKSINNYKNALNLAPNDNGFFITENLVASYYVAGKFEEIDRLVSPKVNLRDIKVSILGIYSFVLLDKNEKKEAEKILLKAIKKGFTRKTLVRLIGINKVEILVEKLKPLGSLD